MKNKKLLIVLLLVAVGMTSNFFERAKDVNAMSEVLDFLRYKILGYEQGVQDEHQTQNERDKKIILELSDDILYRFRLAGRFECVREQKGVREGCEDITAPATIDNVLEYVYGIQVEPVDFQ